MLFENKNNKIQLCGIHNLVWMYTPVKCPQKSKIIRLKNRNFHKAFAVAVVSCYAARFAHSS